MSGGFVWAFRMASRNDIINYFGDMDHLGEKMEGEVYRHQLQSSGFCISFMNYC